MKTGDTFDSNNYGKVKVVDYIHSKKVKVRFLDTNNICYCRADHIRSGKISDPLLGLVEGETYHSNSNGDFILLKYNSNNDIKIKFIGTNNTITTTASDVKTGIVVDNMRPSVYGVGYLGVGCYKPTENGERTPNYRSWCSMLMRCYCESYLSKQPTYRGCYVYEDWKNFQNFSEWYYDTYPKDYYQRELQLDKDSILEGNIMYAPDRCVWITHKENSALAHAKFYTFVSPDGKVLDVYNLSDFCTENGLGLSSMIQVNSGKQYKHRGWTKYNQTEQESEG